MKFSYNWIREFVPGLTQAAGPLERLITMKTAECEGIEETGALLGNAQVVLVESVEPIAGSHNVKTQIDAGPLGKRTVVCGAPNCRAGMHAVWTPIGKKVVSGVESDGMLASASELGISRDHAGILEVDTIAGLVPDAAIEIDNKSITHRPDLWGHHGMAREVAAILGLPLTDPAKLELLPEGPAAIQVMIEDYALCPRYSALVFDNVTVGPSPLWLQYRLTSIGLNPINNIVDLTNFLMAELAQPMHAFDADLLHGDTIFVRTAKAGEHFRALNDESYTLDAANLVIADAAGPIALAGVIGGGESAISDKTTRVVLESANFQASSIRKTSAGIKLRTDASMRFEKAQDPLNTVRALARAVELLPLVSPGIRLVGGVADACGPLAAPPVIELSLAWLARKLGRTLASGEVRRILESLAFTVADMDADTFLVTVPSWRATKDVGIKDDLVEEVGRMIGYDSITPEAPLAPVAPPPANPARRMQHDVRNLFVDNGYTEVYNYSFLSEADVRAFGMDPNDHLRVLNPIAEGQELMRSSLLPGIWNNVKENLKYRDSFRIFEIGQEIHPNETGLPSEVPHLIAAVYDRKETGLFELKRMAECLLPGAQTKPAQGREYEHPARAAEIHWRGELVGRLFELHPRMMETGRAAILDVNLARIAELGEAPTKYTPIRRQPSSAFDLSVVMVNRQHAGDVRSAIAEYANPLIESTNYLWEFALPDGKKSVSYRITVGSPERTLPSEEIMAIRADIIAILRELNYELKV